MRFYLLTVAMAVLTPVAAHAHKMDMVATPDERVVRVVVGYDDDTPCEGATVTLANAAGDVIATGTTNERGVCEFERPAAGIYTIRANDHAGHKASVELPLPQSEAERVSAATVRRNRWLMMAAGLAMIAGVTLVLRRVVRRAGVATP